MAKHRDATIQKRSEILDATLVLFAERGYAGTTVEAIAERLECTKQSLYYYFRTKEDIVISIIEDRLDQALAVMDRIKANPGQANERLRALMHYYFEDSLSGRGFFNVYHQVSGFMDRILQGDRGVELGRKMSGMTEGIMSMVREGIDQGHFLALDHRFLAGMILSMLTGILFHLDHPSLNHVDHQQLATEAIEIIMRGISHGSSLPIKA